MKKIFFAIVVREYSFSLYRYDNDNNLMSALASFDRGGEDEDQMKEIVTDFLLDERGFKEDQIKLQILF